MNTYAPCHIAIHFDGIAALSDFCLTESDLLLHLTVVTCKSGVPLVEKGVDGGIVQRIVRLEIVKCVKLLDRKVGNPLNSVHDIGYCILKIISIFAWISLNRLHLVLVAL